MSASEWLSVGTIVFVTDRDHPNYDQEGEVIRVDGTRRLVRHGGAAADLWYQVDYLSAVSQPGSGGTTATPE